MTRDQDPFADYEHVMDGDQGVCAYFGMAYHAPTAKRLLIEIFTWRNEFRVRCERPGNHGEWSADEIADACFESAMASVVASHAAVAVIAPLFEALIRRAAVKLSESWANAPVPVGTRPDGKGFWDPVIFYETNKKNNKERLSKRYDLRKGFRQMIEQIGYGKNLEETALSVMDAIFAFRNECLHHGYEWPPEKRKCFTETIALKSWTSWFDEVKVVGEKTAEIIPPYTFVRDELVKASLNALENLASSLRTIDTTIEKITRQE